MIYIIGIYFLIVIGLCVTILTCRKCRAVSWAYWINFVFILIQCAYPYRLARVTRDLSALFLK